MDAIPPMIAIAVKIPPTVPFASNDPLKKFRTREMHSKFNELSAGQHQKVMLARGLVQEPEILLLDEPTANLDVKHQLGVTKLLRDISHEDGVLVIMICHDLNIAAKYADSILMMKDGTIYAAGTPEEVITEENVNAVYDVKCHVIEDEGRPHVILREGTL